MYTVANVHIDVPDISGDLSVNVDFLEGLEHSCDGQLICDKASAGCSNRDSRRRRRGIGGSIRPMTGMQKVKQ
jgi:hypothetical protein